MYEVNGSGLILSYEALVIRLNNQYTRHMTTLCQHQNTARKGISVVMVIRMRPSELDPECKYIFPTVAIICLSTIRLIIQA